MQAKYIKGLIIIALASIALNLLQAVAIVDRPVLKPVIQEMECDRNPFVFEKGSVSYISLDKAGFHLAKVPDQQYNRIKNNDLTINNEEGK
jgi:hypothetical protein